MKKRLKIIIPIAILIIIAVIFLVIYMSLVSSKTIDAQLNIEQGTVLLNGEKVTDEFIELKKGDVIETSDDGLANIILYESIVINLEPNTKINLDDLTKENLEVSQEGGETWNQVTNLFGIESYTIKAGNSVASVRGTEFGLTEEKIFVNEGEVDYEINGQKFRVAKGKVIEKIKEEIKQRDLKPEEINKIRLHKQRAIQHLKRLRMDEIRKHEKVVNIIKKKYNLSDEDIREALEKADRGEINLRDYQDKAPVKVESVEKIARITEKIRELNQAG